VHVSKYTGINEVMIGIDLCCDYNVRPGEFWRYIQDYGISSSDCIQLGFLGYLHSAVTPGWRWLLVW